MTALQLKFCPHCRRHHVTSSEGVHCHRCRHVIRRKYLTAGYPVPEFAAVIRRTRLSTQVPRGTTNQSGANAPC